MKQVNIVVAGASRGETLLIDRECLQKIAGVSPRLKVTDASELLVREQRGDLSAKAELDAVLNSADILFALHLPQDLLRRAPHLKWIQIMAAGVEMALSKDITESPVVMKIGRAHV